MKTDRELQDALANILAYTEQTDQSRYPGITYEEGIEVTLHWMLGEMTDEEFGYAGK